MSHLRSTTAVIARMTYAHLHMLHEATPSFIREITPAKKARIDYDGEVSDAWFGLFNDSGNLLAVCDDLSELVRIVNDAGYRFRCGALM